MFGKFYAIELVGHIAEIGVYEYWMIEPQRIPGGAMLVRMSDRVADTTN